jgi:hypothetical protein
MEIIKHKSVHFFVFVLKGLLRLSGHSVAGGAVDELVGPLCGLAENWEFDFHFLLPHFVLGLQQHFHDFGKSFLNGELTELALLDFVSAQLLATATRTAIVLEHLTWGLNHP